MYGCIHRTFNSQSNSLAPDKELNSFVYKTPFCDIVYRSYSFSAHPLNSIWSSTISSQTTETIERSSTIPFTVVFSVHEKYECYGQRRGS